MMRNRKALLYTLLLAGVGLTIIIIVGYVQRSSINAFRRHLLYLTLTDVTKDKVSEAHLWFEELLGADSTVNFEKDVLTPLSSSLTILQGAYDGHETEIGTFAKSDDEDTRAILKQSIILNEKLIAAAKEKWSARSPGQFASPDSVTITQDSVGIAPDSAVVTTAGETDSLQNIAAAKTQNFGELDQAFDVIYKELHQTLENLSTHIRSLSDRERIYLDTISWGSIFLVVAAFAILLRAVYSVQKKQDDASNESRLKIDQESNRVQMLSQFIEAVSGGNYDIEIQQKSEDDNLTSMLVNMRDKLRQTSEEDRRRNWANTGLAQIGEILRATGTSRTDLYDNIIRFIVKYTKSNQGGLFILNEDDEHNRFLELVGCFAFERKKFLTKHIAIGDGLIGQCFLEGESIYLTEVPENYVSITSGLGGTTPSAVLIVPLKINDDVVGVLELASFNKYQDFEIDLVKKLAESIASTISSVKVNETTRLLLERTQQQAEEMKSQEEEIRQNMEELEATQEEMRRKQTVLEQELEQSRYQAETLQQHEKRLTESQDTLQAIVDNIPRAIFWKDRDLRFMGCNKIFAQIAGATSPAELIGKSDYDMAWHAQADAYRRDDMEVMRQREAKLDIEEVNINSEGEESWVLTSKVPIINQRNEVVAILGMFEDITARKKKDAEINRKLHEREQLIRELNQLKQTMDAGKI